MIHPDAIGMRSTTLALFLIGIVSFCCVLRSADKPHQSVSSEEDCARGLSEVRQLRADLARQGVVAFVTNAATPRTAPHIHSQCWVDWLPREEVERRAYEQAKRDFGLDVLGQLEAIAQERTDPQNVKGLLKRAGELLDIAEWLKSTSGYGNYILKRWAEDMALGALAQLAISDRCSSAEVRALLDRVDTHASCARMQVAILNEESPDRWDDPSGDMSADIQRELGREWERRVRIAKEALSSLRTGKRLLLFDVVKNADRRHSFYIPERNPGDATIRHCWNLKDHEEVCIFGMYNHMRKDVEEILRCREALGAIPLPSSSDLKDRPSRERYIDRMDILWAERGRSLGLKPFGRLVTQIIQGKFVDHYTRTLRQ